MAATRKSLNCCRNGFTRSPFHSASSASPTVSRLRLPGTVIVWPRSTGRNTSAPRLLHGCRRAHHCPLSRSVCRPRPSMYAISTDSVRSSGCDTAPRCPARPCRSDGRLPSLSTAMRVPSAFCTMPMNLSVIGGGGGGPGGTTGTGGAAQRSPALVQPLAALAAAAPASAGSGTDCARYPPARRGSSTSCSRFTAGALSAAPSCAAPRAVDRGGGAVRRRRPWATANCPSSARTAARQSRPRAPPEPDRPAFNGHWRSCPAAIATFGSRSTLRGRA